jgi:2-methylcitrate dehydratase PrpD
VPDPAHRTAFLDWLACAVRGQEEPAARAADELDDPVAAVATAGHVLDFDDTYLPGIAHLSAPTAPVALLLAETVGEALEAYAAGFEAMGALARASHPALYDRGLHPTAVCGGVGAAVTASRLLGLDREAERSAVALALVGSGGLRAAFGSDAKSLQVGWAASSGVRAARLAAGGARAPLDAAAAGWAEATGGAYAEADPAEPAIERNWIKAWPCCLQTHGSIEAAERARAAGEKPATVVVHPVSLQAAGVGPVPADGLQAKFSIPYLIAWTLQHGPPGVDSFASVDAEAVRRAEAIEVRADPDLLESEAVLLDAGGAELERVEAATGSPEHPLDAAALTRKLADLGAADLAGALDDPARPASDLAARLRSARRTR